MCVCLKTVVGGNLCVCVCLKTVVGGNLCVCLKTVVGGK